MDLVKPFQQRSHRQLALPLEREIPIRLGETAHQEMIGALADLLLEALQEAPGKPQGGALNECEN